MASESLINAIKERISDLSVKQFLKTNRDPVKRKKLQQRIKNLWRAVGRMRVDR